MKVLRPVLIALGLLLAVSTVHAQEPVLKANIPFNFVVGNRWMPAGDYVLNNQLPGSGLVAVRDAEQNNSSVVGTTPVSLTEPSKTTKLVFHRMGGEYFLYQIWVEGRATGREFPKTKLEIQMAKYHTNEDEIIIAAVITR